LFSKIVFQMNMACYMPAGLLTSETFSYSSSAPLQMVLTCPQCEIINGIELWQPRTRRWTHHTDVAGSKNEAARESDNSDHTKQQFELVTRLGQSCISNYTTCRARGLLCVQCGYRDSSVQCKPTSEQLMMWERYPHIDTSPHRIPCEHCTTVVVQKLCLFTFVLLS
jgi:hypothetical protein